MTDIEAMAKIIAGKPDAFIVETTKAFVDFALSRNTHNRPVHMKRATEMARDMKRGEWALAPDAVAFSSDGVLMNGQHRLIADAAAGYPPIPLLIQTGTDAEAQNKTDIGIARTTSDRLCIYAERLVSKTFASAIRCVVIFGENGRRSGRATDDELNAAYEKHKGTLACFPTGCFRGFSAGMIAALLCAVSGGVPARLAVDFILAVRDGTELVKGSPVIEYRNKFVIRSSKRGVSPSCHGASFQKFSFETTQTLFRRYVTRRNQGLPN